MTLYILSLHMLQELGLLLITNAMMATNSHIPINYNVHGMVNGVINLPYVLNLVIQASRLK